MDDKGELYKDISTRSEVDKLVSIITGFLQLNPMENML